MRAEGKLLTKAERQPRDSRATAERQPRDSREQPRESRETAEAWLLTTAQRGSGRPSGRPGRESVSGVSSQPPRVWAAGGA